MRKLIYLLPYLLLFLFSCADPCKNTECGDGYCSDGECVCPEGYFGTGCSSQLPPSSIKISKVTISKFPSSDSNGIPWDFASKADLYFTIISGVDLICNPGVYYENASTNATYEFDNISGSNITKIFLDHEIILYDYDTDSNDDEIGRITFTPYYITNGFPSKLSFAENGIEVSIEVEYFY